MSTNQPDDRRSTPREVKPGRGRMVLLSGTTRIGSEPRFERVAVEFIPRRARHSEVGTLGLKIKILTFDQIADIRIKAYGINDLHRLFCFHFRFSIFPADYNKRRGCRKAG